MLKRHIMFGLVSCLALAACDGRSQVGPDNGDIATDGEAPADNSPLAPEVVCEDAEDGDNGLTCNKFDEDLNLVDTNALVTNDSVPAN